MKKTGEWFLWLVMIVAAGFVLYHWFYPVYHYFYDDEWFVLPERVWFKSSMEWLNHLLFFNQTRFTYSGDQILVRPGLFLWMWIQDILFRSDRVAQQVFLAGVAVGAFGIFFFALRRECGKWLAFAAAIFAFSCLPGLEFYSWSHLSGYVLALAFYILALHLQFSGNLTFRRALMAGILFFLAETCHELIAVTLAFMVAIELFRSRPIWRRENRLRLLPPLGALAVYGLMVLVIWSLYPPKLISGTATQSVPMTFDNFMMLSKIMGSVFLQVLNNLVPFPSVHPNLNILRWVLGGIAITLLSVHQYLRPQAIGKFRGVVIPLVILFVGLALGRVSMQGVVKVHYFPMFQFFAVLAVALMWPTSKWGRRLAPMLALVLIASSVRNAVLVSESRPARDEWIGAAITAASEISEYFANHPERCFAGVYDPLLRTRLNAGLNISFQLSSCGWREGQPVIFQVDGEGRISEFSASSTVASVRITERLSLPTASSELDSYLVQAPLNLKELSRSEMRRGIQLRYLYEPLITHRLKARFKVGDGFPILYNSGVAVAGDRGPVFFVIMNNMLRLLTLNQDNALAEFAFVQLPEMKSEFTLDIADNGEVCEIYLNEFLVTQIPACLKGPVKIGTFTFNNGTPAETLVDLAVSPY